MNNRSFCRLRLQTTSFLRCLLILAGALVLSGNARAGAPDWLRALTHETLPQYPADTAAVLLLDEQVTTISDSGEMKTVYRRAYKILRPKGRGLGTVIIYYDNETRITFLKAWSIPRDGKEFEVKEKDAVDFSSSGGSLYQDDRGKALEIPAAEPGNIIGYEYEQKRRRPSLLQDLWDFQDVIPVRRARYVLQLPKSWEYKSTWENYAGVEPHSVGDNDWVWEIENVPAVEPELSMPPWRAVAGHLSLTFFGATDGQREKSHGSWQDVGRWYSQLVAGRRQSTPEIQQKVAELTAGKDTLIEKLRALAAFAQRDIRYVSIQIGIGGYQPHAASDIFTNHYGDCKDKVTLLSAMVHELGLESNYVLVNASRGRVLADFPSMLNFNHVILAIHLPADTPVAILFAAKKYDPYGLLLFFDPTDDLTPLGYLPSSLQASKGLLVSGQGGELIDLPLLPPTVNRLMRSAKLSLAPNGKLSGEVQEIRWGAPGTYLRAQLLAAQGPERRKVMERFLSQFLSGINLVDVKVENLEDYDANLIVRYSFTAESYAKTAGDLMLLRPRVLGTKSDDILETDKPRKYPVEFEEATLQSDIYTITLPLGYKVDELPPPTDVDTGFAKYNSEIKVEGNALNYSRTYQVRDVIVPTARLEDLKKFYRKVIADERNSAILKRLAP
jgi:hypothetical protein